MPRKKLLEELKKRGISYDDMEDVIDEAERKKLILLDYETLSAYLWIPPEHREKEEQKTDELKELVEEAFMGKRVEKLVEDELKEILTSKGLSAEEVERALLEAERDCILSSYPFTKKGWVYELIPSEDRVRELECRRLGKLYTERWLYEKRMYGFKV